MDLLRPHVPPGVRHQLGGQRHIVRAARGGLAQSLHRLQLQPRSLLTYGCSLAHLRLQPRSPTVAAALTYGCRYVLPAEAFPTAVRSSFFGCSACLGKLGALLGTYTFGPIAAMGAHGITWVFVVCAAVSLVGVGVTHAFVEPYGHGTSHLWLGFGYG